jgi:hypothetical protein
MFAKPNRFKAWKIVVTAISGVVITGLGGCQTSPYSRLEKDVYNCVNEFSRKIPKGFVEHTTAVDKGIYGYSDPGLKMSNIGALRGKGRALRYQFDDPSCRDFFAGYLNRDDLNPWRASGYKDTSSLKPNSLLMFGARSPTPGAEDSIENELIALMKPTKAVVYLKKVEGSVWRRCELLDFLASEVTIDELERECTKKGGTRVPTEQVQRYIDLAERFYKTYPLPPMYLR